MRTWVFALIASLFVATVLSGCGSSNPPQAPTSPGGGKASGAASLVPELGETADAVVTVDLAGIRANPVLARAVAEGDRNPATKALLDRIDRIDLRAMAPGKGRSELVAVLWGKLGRDPQAMNVYGLTFEEAGTVGADVKEYRVQGVDLLPHVFVIDDATWVVTSGEATKRIRARFATSSSVPPAPSGTLLRIRLNAAALEQVPRAKALGDIDKLEVTLASDADSLRAVIAFKEAEAAKTAASKLRALTMLLSVAMAANKDCKAFEKIRIDVKEEATDVTVDVKGLGDATARWDANACARATHAGMTPPDPASPPPPDAKSASPKLCALLRKKGHPSPFDRNSPPRARAVVVTEIEGLEKLLASTAETAKDRGALVARTATAYGEWEMAVIRGCAANLSATGSAEDGVIGDRLPTRTKALCGELAKSHPKSPQCK